MNNEAWEAIFDELKIESELEVQPFFTITAKQINEIGKREARLMAKFDTKESLPSLFKKHSLNINAISNGTYIIFKDEGHKSFLTLPDYKLITPKRYKPVSEFELQTLQFNTKMSESNAIDYAHHCGILSEYSGEPNLKLTTRGRFFSDKFSFQLGNVGSVDVKSVQVEVDAGYEGINQFIILEAKSGTRSTFNIRQLYYPYRHFQTRTSKKIRTILSSFSNGVYYFTELELTNDYYSHRIVSNVAIAVETEIEESLPTIKTMMSLPAHSPINIPVPQADDLNKVIDLATLLLDNPLNKFQISEHFEFDERQGDYYAKAAQYIGIIEKNGRQFYLTKMGKQIVGIQNRDKRNVRTIQAILQTSLFHDIMVIFLDQNNNIHETQVLNRLSEEDISGSTLLRRKGTVTSWLNWIAENLNLEKK